MRERKKLRNKMLFYSKIRPRRILFYDKSIIEKDLWEPGWGRLGVF
jgi:hypothetical protein